MCNTIVWMLYGELHIATMLMSNDLQTSSAHQQIAVAHSWAVNVALLFADAHLMFCELLLISKIAMLNSSYNHQASCIAYGYQASLTRKSNMGIANLLM